MELDGTRLPAHPLRDLVIAHAQRHQAQAEADKVRGAIAEQETALKAQYDAAADDAARSRVALAARLGTAAMDGREDEA